MIDPERLKSRDDAGARLLRAGGREAPSAGARRRASLAVGAAVALTATESSAAVLGITTTRVLVMKAIAYASAVTIVGGATYVATTPSRPIPRPHTAPSPVVTAVAPPLAPTTPAATTQPSPSAPLVTSLPLPLVPAPVVALAPTVSAVPVRAALADEVEALARAQQALEQHRATDALRLIDAFYADFPQPHLRPEADALRIEALAAAGDKAGAQSFLRAFRTAYPGSPLEGHLDTVTR